jgi:hypothetical protein
MRIPLFQMIDQMKFLLKRYYFTKVGRSRKRQGKAGGKNLVQMKGRKGMTEMRIFRNFE